MQIDEMDFAMFIGGECSKQTLQIYDGVKQSVGPSKVELAYQANMK